MDGDTFWLAKGTCGGCGRGVARRVDGPGAHEAACNVCRATTRIAATLMRRTPEGPRPVAAAPAPMAPSPAADAAPRRLHVPREILVGAVGLLVLAAIAGGAAWAVLGQDDPTSPTWDLMTQSLSAERVGDEVRFTSAVTAFDGEGNALDPAGQRGPEPWHFALVETLRTPSEVEEWTTCPAIGCAFSAPATGIILIALGEPSDFGAHAYDPVAGTLRTHVPMGGWQEPSPAGDPLVQVMSGRAVAVETTTKDVLVFIEDNSENGLEFRVTLLQGGDVLGEEVLGGSGNGFTTFRPVAEVEAARFLVRVSVDGEVRFEQEFDAGLCDRASLSVRLQASADGTIQLADPFCA